MYFTQKQQHIQMSTGRESPTRGASEKENVSYQAGSFSSQPQREGGSEEKA